MPPKSNMKPFTISLPKKGVELITDKAGNQGLLFTDDFYCSSFWKTIKLGQEKYGRPTV